MSEFRKSQYAPCPNCGGEESKKVGFTWWGGVIGPAMLTHVRCPRCGSAYNGKSGQSNTTGIIIYSVVVLAIVIGLFVILGVVFNNKM